MRALRAPKGAFGWLEALVLAGGIGLGIATWLGLLALHVTTSQPWALEAIVALAFWAALPKAQVGGGVPAPPPGERATPGFAGRRWLPAADLLLGAFVAFLLVDHVRAFLGLTLTAPLGQWDAKAIWNLKARYLFRAGLDWRGVVDPALALSHVDYPWLLPLALLRGWHAAGHESAAVGASLAGAFGLGTLVLVVCSLRRARGPLAGWLGGLALLVAGDGKLPALLTESAAQQADVPVAFFVVAMVASLADARPGARAPWAFAGLLGSLAAWTKNEGALWLACALLGAALVPPAGRGRGLRERLRAPGWLMAGALPGLLVLALFKLTLAGPNDLAGMTTAAALRTRMCDTSRWDAVLGAMKLAGLELLPRLGLWGLLVPPALHVAGRFLARCRADRAVATGSSVASVTVLFCGLALVAIFVGTPVDLQWHLATSGSRLLLQLWPAGVVASVSWVGGACSSMALPARSLRASG